MSSFNPKDYMTMTEMEVRDFFQKHWKKGAVAVALALAFALGRFGTAEKVEYVEREKIVEVEKVVEVEVEKVVEKVVYVNKTKAREKTTTTVVESPDGTKTSTTTTDSALDTSTELENEKVVEKIVYVDRDRIVEVEKLVETSKTIPMPDWRIGVLATVDPLDAIALGVVDPSNAALGVEVQRRLVGPIYGSASVTTHGTVGVAVGLEF